MDGVSVEYKWYLKYLLDSCPVLYKATFTVYTKELDYVGMFVYSKMDREHHETNQIWES